jgi:hypothetical protein
MSMTADDLFGRLPAFWRARDDAQGGALRALLNVIAAQGAVMEADIARMYDGWFIETCDDWLVPYIGDLLGVRGLYGVEGTAAFGQRALVADTLRTRRRKGTVPALEQVARDSTGWPAHAVEFFQRMQATQNVNHLRPACLRTPDLRDAAALERLGGPFEDATHTVEVRPPPSGRYDIPNVGIFLWRLQAYVDAATRIAARRHPVTQGLWYVDPLGRDTVMFNPPQPLAQPGTPQLSQPVNVPEPLSRRVLHDELAALRQAIADGDEPVPGRFPANGNGAAVRVWLGGVPVEPERLVVCDLSPLPGVAPEDWRRPPAQLVVASTRPGRPATTFPRTAGDVLVGFDPLLGRVALPTGRTDAVETACAYGFPGDVGGGPYDRRPASHDADATAGLLSPTDFVDHIAVPGQQPTLAAALAAVQPGRSTLITWDSDDAETVSPVVTLTGTHLAIEAANRRHPILDGDFTFGGIGGQLTLSGVTLSGRLALKDALAAVELRHASLLPTGGGIVLADSAPELTITLRRTLCGPVATAQPIAGLVADECVFDATAQVAIALPDSSANLSNCTVLGRTQVGELVASNCLFTEAVQVDRLQQGCVRFSYVPPGSVTPRQYRCQPDLVMRNLSGAAAASEAVRVTPSFTSISFGNPAYVQLLRSCAPEIRAGADDGAEMGVWNLLKQPQRETNLRQVLDEYLPTGLEAGAIFVN